MNTFNLHTLLRPVKHLSIITLLSGGMITASHAQPTARDLRGAAPVVAIKSEPPPLFIVDPPLPEALAGRVVVHYRTENLRIVPVFGAPALQVSPRIGHLHITVDNTTWHWADASNEPLIINGLPPGEHTVLLELADPTHKVITSKTVNFVIPAIKRSSVQQVFAALPRTEPAPKLIVDPPLPDQLALGRVFVQYSTENLRILPVYGKAALDVSPRIGHINVTVDDGAWHWADASNETIIIVGMSPGSHNILIDLVDAANRILAQKKVSFIVPDKIEMNHTQH